MSFIKKKIHKSISSIAGKSRIGFIIFILIPISDDTAFAQALSATQIVKMAVDRYPAVAARRLSYKAAKGDIFASRLAYAPTLSVSTQASNVTYVPNSVGLSGGNIPVATITLTQPLFGTGAGAGVRRTKAAAEAADYAVGEAVSDIQLRVSGYYVDWRHIHRRTAILSANVQDYQGWIEKLNRRKQGGVGSAADVELALSRLLQAQADLATEQQNELVVLSEISEIIGRPVRSEDVLLSDDLSYDLSNCSDATATAVRESPTLARLRAEARQAKEAASQAKTQALPQIGLQIQKQYGNATTPGYPGFTSIGIVLQYGTGSGLAGLFGAKGAAIRARAAGVQEEAAMIDYETAMQSQCLSYLAADARAQTVADVAKSMLALDKSYSTQYEAGKRTIIDLLGFLREKNAALLNVVDAEASAETLKWRLYIATTPEAVVEKG